MFTSFSEFVGVLLILLFPAWGLAGLFASMWHKRSTLRSWWFGSYYGSVGEPHAGPVLNAQPATANAATGARRDYDALPTRRTSTV